MRIIIEVDHIAPTTTGEQPSVQVTTAEAQAPTARDAGRFAGVPGVDATRTGESVGAVPEGGSAARIPAGPAPTIADNPPVRAFTAAVTASPNGEPSG